MPQRQVQQMKNMTPGAFGMKDNHAQGVETMSLHASYEFYFDSRRAPFWQWLRMVDDRLDARLPSYAAARLWWLEGLTIDRAIQRHLENLESAQEERSYYDV
jgi:hypothetical protein